MGVLDQIMQMRAIGRTDSEIIRYLQSQGVQPKEIQDALNQAQIKSAVSGEEDMQQSIMNAAPVPDQYTPYQQTEQQAYPQEAYYPPQQGQEIYYPQEQYQYPQQQQPQQQQEVYYPQQAEYYPQQGQDYSSGADSSTMMEISEQVFSEKIKKIEKPLDSLNEFKTIAETRLKIMEEKLQRIEMIIDKLQISILDKVGSYGNSLNSIKKEMEMMQSSFGKIVNSSVEKYKK